PRRMPLTGTRGKAVVRRTKPRRIHHVVASLGRDIVHGITPVGGSVAPEPELEQRFEVSRGVVREAVKILSAKGLIEVRPRSGTPRTHPSCRASAGPSARSWARFSSWRWAVQAGSRRTSRTTRRPHAPFANGIRPQRASR